jgi:hypothetical protein
VPRYAPPVKERYTLAEAAEVTGLTVKALARRVERGSLRSSHGRDGRRYVTLKALAEAGLVNPATGQPPAWSRQGIDAQAVARELVDTVIRQGIELHELHKRLSDLALASDAGDAAILEQIARMDEERDELRADLERASRERAELRRQLERQSRSK